MKTGILNSVLDKLEVLDVGGDHVEVGHEVLASHADGRDVAAEGFTVDDVLLREDMDDFLAGIEHGVVLVGDEVLDILPLDETVVRGNHNAALGGTRLDVLSGDAHPHFVDVDVGLVGGFFDSTANRLGGVGDVLHHTVLHALGVGFTEAQDFHFSRLDPHTHEAGDFGGSDVESNNDFVFHNYVLFCLFISCSSSR